MDPVTDLLQRLQETQGDIRAQAAVTAEFLIATKQAKDQKLLRAALDAAAILRWFDVDLLAKVLEITQDGAQSIFHLLTTFSFVEHYRRGGTEHYNIHEATRLGWRKKLAQETTEYFRALSTRAASCFADRRTPAATIEWIYHLLCGDPEHGASELEQLDREWSDRGRPEDRYALAAALQELYDTRVVDGRAARLRRLLAVAGPLCSASRRSWRDGLALPDWSCS